MLILNTVYIYKQKNYFFHDFNVIVITVVAFVFKFCVKSNN